MTTNTIETQLIKHLNEYFLSTHDSTDLKIVFDYINEIAQLSFYYYITKKFEKSLSDNNLIDQKSFEFIMNKWFSLSHDNISFL